MENENIIPEKKETKVNINMRINEKLKEKIKEQMSLSNMDANEFFSEMFYEYLKKQSLDNGAADYSADVLELEMVSKRVLTIVQNVIEKSYMQNAIVQETHKNILNDTISEHDSKHMEIVAQLTSKLASVQKEYDLISEQAQALIDDNKDVKQNVKLLQKNNSQNEELIKSFRDQIVVQKNTISELETKLLNTISSKELEQAKLNYDKQLIAIEKEYQTKISTLQNELNTIQIKYIESFQKK